MCRGCQQLLLGMTGFFAVVSSRVNECLRLGVDRLFAYRSGAGAHRHALVQSPLGNWRDNCWTGDCRSRTGQGRLEEKSKLGHAGYTRPESFANGTFLETKSSAWLPERHHHEFFVKRFLANSNDISFDPVGYVE
jgi:hypothetical protein